MDWDTSFMKERWATGPPLSARMNQSLSIKYGHRHSRHYKQGQLTSSDTRASPSPASVSTGTLTPPCAPEPRPGRGSGAPLGSDQQPRQLTTSASSSALRAGPNIPVGGGPANAPQTFKPLLGMVGRFTASTRDSLADSGVYFRKRSAFYHWSGAQVPLIRTAAPRTGRAGARGWRL